MVRLSATTLNVHVASVIHVHVVHVVYVIHVVQCHVVHVYVIHVVHVVHVVYSMSQKKPRFRSRSVPFCYRKTGDFFHPVLPVPFRSVPFRSVV